MKALCFISSLLLPLACNRTQPLQITGGAGRDVHDPRAQIVQEQYFVSLFDKEYFVKRRGV